MTSIKFQLLNESFVLGSFRNHNVYEKIPGFLESALEEQSEDLDEEELEGYSGIAKQFTPVVAQEIVETNIKEILSFMTGKSDEIIVFFPARKLGIQLDKDMGDRIPLTTIAPNFPKKHLEYMSNVGKWVTIGWVMAITLCAVLLLLHYQLGRKKKTKATAILLMFSSLTIIIFGLIAHFFFIQITHDLAESKEPSQRIISILSSSSLPDMINTWMVISVVFLSSGICLLALFRFQKSS
jgi:hypothetical protein